MSYPIPQTDQAAQDRRSLASAIVNTEPSLTLQGPAAEADINNIVKMYGSPALFPVPPQVTDPAYYGDLSDVPDLATALERIQTAREHFERLPARLRAEFDNDPATLYEWVNDPQNAAEAVEIGLLKARPPERTVPEPEKAATPSPS